MRCRGSSRLESFPGLCQSLSQVNRIAAAPKPTRRVKYGYDRPSRISHSPSRQSTMIARVAATARVIVLNIGTTSFHTLQEPNALSFCCGCPSRITPCDDNVLASLGREQLALRPGLLTADPGFSCGNVREHWYLVALGAIGGTRTCDLEATPVRCHCATPLEVPVASPGLELLLRLCSIPQRRRQRLSCLLLWSLQCAVCTESGLTTSALLTMNSPSRSGTP